MSVYAYSRVSTERQVEEGVSLDEQHRRIDGQALMEGWTIAERFVECGVSGSVPLGERVEGAKLLALLQPGDIVIAAKLDNPVRGPETEPLGHCFDVPPRVIEPGIGEG